jgi:hypothetical protein
MTKILTEELKQQAIIEALEFYIYRLKKDNCTQSAIDLFTQVLKEVNPNETKTAIDQFI